MKIGILTYHRAHNFGAMLQAYALKQVLQKKGYDTQLIDYWPLSHQKQYALIKKFRGNNFIDGIKNLIVDILTLYRRYVRIQQFEDFAGTYLNLPKEIQYSKDQQIITEDFDCVIVGSDQIWRNHINQKSYTGFDPAYYCQTLKTKSHCISYAASMGIINMTTEEANTLKQYLQEFSTILVRENSLKKLIEDLGFQAEVVVDPTLLLNMEQWNELLPSNRFKKQKYILYYELIQSQEATIFANQKAQEMKCDLLVMSATTPPFSKKNYINCASPIDFMHAIRDAEYVIATSFHGTAFSIIFEKQFLTIGLKNNADRVITLLQHLNITDHYQEKPKQVQNINYKDIKHLYTTMQQQSLDLLLTAIKK